MNIYYNRYDVIICGTSIIHDILAILLRCEGKRVFMLIEIGIMEVRVDLWINYQNFGTSLGQVKSYLIICVFILNHQLY